MPNFTPNPIDLSGVSNARDYAGYPTKNGIVKPKKLLRGAHLHRMTESDQNKLKNEYNVVHIIDLRTSIEIEQHPNLPLDCANTYHFNVVGDDSMLSANPEEMLKIIMKSHDPDNYLSSLYQDFVQSQSAQSAYSALFDVLLNETEHATYWHCTAGKDRTGFAGALILCALGADYDLVMKNVNIIREINKEYGYSVSILGDLQGPKLRVGVVKEGSFLNPGDILTFTNEKIEGDSTRVYMTYQQFPQDVKVGERILIDDGKLVFEVIETNNLDTVRAKTIYNPKLNCLTIIPITIDISISKKKIMYAKTYKGW